ncbi:replication initiator [Kitasatospora phosalacinea]|uniref:replication initiator n=1 Tax=Kitasatospora phosalacinea TaxID=2065 RepID=UPI0036522195
MVTLDLRHVASPAVRDLLHLVNHPYFDRTQQQIEHLGGCTEPVRLTGHTATVDTTTGEVLRSYTTSDEPMGSLLTTCGNRRASRCPACSRLYATDTYHLIRAGLSGGKNVPDTVRTHPRAFVTLTPPSFGPVHNRPTTPGGDVRPCRCRKLHGPTDPLLGTPLNPATYDYAGAVLFNAHAGALWARFTTYLRREIAARLGMTQKAVHAVLRVSFAKVAEYQQRGLVHFHAVIRLDGPDGSSQPPPPYAAVAVLTGAARVRVRVESDAVGERELSWGEQLDVCEMTAFGTDSEFTDQAVAAYVAKYATKSADASGTLDRALFCRPCQGRGMAPSAQTGVPVECRTCTGTGQSRPLPRLAVERHVRQMIRTCWDLGQRPEFADLKLWKWAHMLGFRGHFSTKSRCYSVTLGQLRDARRAWRTEQARAHVDLPDLNPSTTLVVGRWAYQGSGYSPGEELLAATVRHGRELERQFVAEGGCS